MHQELIPAASEVQPQNSMHDYCCSICFKSYPRPEAYTDHIISQHTSLQEKMLVEKNKMIKDQQRLISAQ